MEEKMKKSIWLPGLPACVLVLVLVLGILCASCDTSGGAEKWSDITSLDQLDGTWSDIISLDQLDGTWSDITSLAQLDGTWKGSYQQTMPIQETAGLLGQAESDMGGMITLLGDMNAAVSADITLTIDAGKETRSGSVKTTITFSGGTINYTWGMMQLFLMAYFPDAVFNDKNHSMTVTQDIPEEPITDEEKAELLSSGLQINQNGQKIKVPATAILEESSEVISSGIIPDEIILTKQ